LKLADEFFNALIFEISLRKDLFSSTQIETIYFGGGTPSLFSPERLQQLIEQIEENYNLSENAEITIELNPDDVTHTFVNKLKKTKINRVSLGIQAFYNYHLQLMNRRHKVFGALKSVESLKEMGYNNISIDLIYGLPEMTMAEWEKSLNKAVNMDIQHISAYHLTYEEGTVFDKLKKSGMLVPPDDEISYKQFNAMIDHFEQNGFIHYELSNFGRMGRFSKHNMNYWQNEPYLGFGPSAHSFDGKRRFWNIPDISRYLRIEKKRDDIQKEEVLSESDRFNEYIMTGLRTYWGIDLNYVQRIFGEETASILLSKIKSFVESGHIRNEDDKYFLTRSGMFISDTIAAELFVEHVKQSSV
jgi:oxygen-independent coproporphyrinogen-3 oxidase